MLKQVVCSLFLCAAVANAGIIYTFTVFAGPLTSGLLEAIQFTSPTFLAPREPRFVQMDSSLLIANATFENDTSIGGPPFGGMAWSVLIMHDITQSISIPNFFTEGAYTTSGSYHSQVFPDAPSSKVGELIVLQTPEPGSAALIFAGLCTGGLIQRRRRSERTAQAA
jgi:hypothetical protein